MKSIISKAMALAALAVLIALPAAALDDMETFGKELYFDRSLSSPSNQSCAVCHEGRAGFSGPVPGINKAGAVYPGAVKKRFGNRRPPTASYAGDSPVFHYDEYDALFVGGMFWDGRATGWVTGDPLADQAMGPFLNPVEQNLSSEEEACRIVARSKYAYLYQDVFDGPIDCKDYDTTDGHLKAYKNFARAIAAFERSIEVNPFDSKFDYVINGEAMFTDQEAWGLELFNGKGMCSLCHISESSEGEPPLFTDFTYDNLGVPKNPENPFYNMDKVFIDGGAINPEGADWIDPGLAGFLEKIIDEVWSEKFEDLVQDDAVEESYGKHKVPTLRNVDKRPGPGFPKSYTHNGYFKSLESIVHFYNTRDTKDPCGGDYTDKEAMKADCWPPAEVAENVNVDELGNLGLTTEEEAALVAFMKTLSDGYKPPKSPKKGKK